MTLSSPLKLVFPALALLASFLAFEAPAALADTPEKRTISLSATGAVKTTPDKVDITTGVTAEGQTAREALDKNTEAMSKVVAGLKEAGIDPKDIQTTNFSVSPIYEQKKQEMPYVLIRLNHVPPLGILTRPPDPAVPGRRVPVPVDPEVSP